MPVRKKTLYYWPDTASLAPHICLIQAGVDFDLVRMDLTAGKFTTTWYKDLNPHFRIPTYTEGDPNEGGLVLYEAAAICLHLAEAHPSSGLLPPVGTDMRAHALKHLIYLTNTLQAELMIHGYAERHCEDKAAVPTIRAATQRRLEKMFGFFDTELADGRSWLAGDVHTCADHYLLMLCGWAEYFRIAPPPSSFKILPNYLRRCQDRPPVTAAFQREEIEMWF